MQKAWQKNTKLWLKEWDMKTLFEKKMWNLELTVMCIIMCSLNGQSLNLWTMVIESESCLEKDFMYP
jgi:hypothetical protein